MRVQHEEQKHSAGGRGTGRMQSQRAPSLHPLPPHSTAGPGQGPLRPMSGVNPTLLIRVARYRVARTEMEGNIVGEGSLKRQLLK